MTDAPASIGADSAQEAVDPPPPRMKTLTLCNFRGFPGPAPVPLRLNGKNAVVFGENGAGKSSIFHALDGFFSIAERSPEARRNRLSKARNLFSELEPKDTWLEVEFDDGEVERWSIERHPCDLVQGRRSSSRVYEAAYRKAIVDYKLLLETNFRHSAGTINLFDVCIRGVLRDFRAAHEGSEETLYALWTELERYIDPPRGEPRDPARRELFRISFNAGLSTALEAIVPTINEMLGDMGWGDVQLRRLEFPLLVYNREWRLRDRGFLGTDIRPVLSFHGQDLEQPHLFLNEARLSALALAIYFAGRKLCAQTVLTGSPQIMVLDDVLIGLDQSNRIPVLDLLAKHFSTWQIVLLTHDRFWFDITRSYHRRHRADKYWQYWELQPGENLKSPPTPLIVSASAAREAVELAQRFLDQGHINAAGNAVRIACEKSVREFCEVKKASVKYSGDREKTPFSDLLAGAREWSNRSANAAYGEALSDIEMYASAMLNSLSHGGTSNLTKHEVQGAIVAVRGLLLTLKVTSKFE